MTTKGTLQTSSQKKGETRPEFHTLARFWLIYMLSQNFLKKITGFIATLFCLVAVVTLQQSQLNNLKKKETISAENLKQEVEAEKLRLSLLKKLPSFGFDNLIADWIFLSFLQYFGDDLARQHNGYSLSPEYFEIIVDRDPRFLDSYLFLSTSVSQYAEMPERAVALMAKGLKSLSANNPRTSYYIWRNKGIDELLFLGDGKAAQKSFEMAAAWASVHSDPESKTVEEISRKTALFLARKPDSKIAQVSAWSMILARAVDGRSRQLAISRIQALGGQVSITPEGAVKVFLPKAD